MPVDIERPDSRHRLHVGYQYRQHATTGLAAFVSLGTLATSCD
jgi:hypothetical protein